MGRYSSTGLAHGTHGAPQITMEESSYSLKIAEIINKFNLNTTQDKTTASVAPGKKQKHNSQNKNIIELIIALIVSMGFEKILVNNSIMFIRNDIVIKVKYIEEYSYYILEKADSLLDAQNNNFELLASISNEIGHDKILETIKNVLIIL